MRTSRPRLGFVLAVVLLWQLGAGLLLAGPAFASIGDAHAAGPATPHCHTDRAAGSAAHPAPHTTAPDCCQNLSACHCSCAQSSFVAAPDLTPTPFVSDASVRASVASPPPVQRTAEFFRPPI